MIVLAVGGVAAWVYSVAKGVDIDKLKPTDFKTEVLFELVDTLYRRKHGLTVTGNYSLRIWWSENGCIRPSSAAWTTCAR